MIKLIHSTQFCPECSNIMSQTWTLGSALGTLSSLRQLGLHYPGLSQTVGAGELEVHFASDDIDRL